MLCCQSGSRDLSAGLFVRPMSLCRSGNAFTRAPTGCRKGGDSPLFMDTALIILSSVGEMAVQAGGVRKPRILNIAHDYRVQASPMYVLFTLQGVIGPRHAMGRQQWGPVRRPWGSASFQGPIPAYFVKRSTNRTRSQTQHRI